MIDPSASIRRHKFQISLRWLLLLMIPLAVVLSVYGGRWVREWRFQQLSKAVRLVDGQVGRGNSSPMQLAQRMWRDDMLADDDSIAVLLTSPQSNDETLRSLSDRLRFAPKLMLSVSQSSITSDGMTMLRDATNLRAILVNPNQFDQRSVATFQSLPQLVGIGLEGPALNDEKISLLRQLPNVERLFASGPLTDASLDHIRALPRLVNFTHYLTKFTPDGLARLAKDRPDLRIEEYSMIATSLAAKPIKTSAVRTILFSPDGELLVSGSGTGHIRVWLVKDGTLLYQRQAHDDWTFGLSFDATGQRLLTGGGDNLVKMWNVATGELLQTFSDHRGDVHDVAFSLGEHSIISAGDDCTISVADITGHSPSIIARAHSAPITTIAVSPATGTIASGSRDTTVRLWEPERLNLEMEFRGPGDDVMSVEFSPDGQQLAAASYDGNVYVWNVGSPEPRRVFRGHSDRLYSVRFSPDGSHILAGGEGGSLREWDFNSGQMTTIETNQPDISEVALGPSAGWLSTSSSNGRVLLWQRGKGQRGRELTRHCDSSANSTSVRLYPFATSPVCVSGRSPVCALAP
jgi:WD40 repeat protein